MTAHSPFKGIVLMSASGLAFCGMSVLIRHADNVDSYRIALCRFIIGFGLLGTAALFGRIRLSFVNGPLLFLRGLTGGVAVFLFFLSIARLGIGKGTVISYSYPVFATVFSAVLLRERIGSIRSACVGSALLGIALMSCDRGISGAVLGVGLYEALAILGALLSGVAVVVVKKLHDTDSTYAIFFSQCVIGLWVVVVPANVSSMTIGYRGGIVLLCIGVCAAVGQLLMTEGYRHTSVVVGSLLGMLVPVLNFAAGWLLFQESMSPRALFGAVVVMLSCILVILCEQRDRRRVAGRMPPAATLEPA